MACLWCPGTVSLVVARSNEGKTEILKSQIASFFNSDHYNNKSIECVKVMAPAVSLGQYRALQVPCRLELGPLPDANDALPERSDEPHELTRLVPSRRQTTIIVIDDTLSMLKPNQTHPFITDVINSLAHRSCAMVFFLAQTVINANLMTRAVMRCARLIHIKLCASQERDLITLNRQFFYAQPNFLLDACKYINSRHRNKWFTLDLRDEAKFRIQSGVYDMDEMGLLVNCSTPKFHGEHCVKFAVSESDYRQLTTADASSTHEPPVEEESSPIERILSTLAPAPRERALALLQHLQRVNATTNLRVHIDADDLSLIVCDRRIVGSCMGDILAAVSRLHCACTANTADLRIPGTQPSSCRRFFTRRRSA